MKSIRLPKCHKCLWLIFLAVSLMACSDNLRNGDLVFQTNDSSDFTDAIVSSTDRDGLSFSHVGIVYSSDTGQYIIEATTKHGVVATAINDFLDDSAHDKKGHPLVRFYRIKISQDLADKAVKRALSFIGKPYDFAFSPGTESIYCSELVYESYIDEKGHHIFTTQPMNFRDAEGNLPPYWIEHFEKLGIAIPENEDGTNPNDMANSDMIEALRTRF